MNYNIAPINRRLFAWMLDNIFLFLVLVFLNALFVYFFDINLDVLSQSNEMVVQSDKPGEEYKKMSFLVFFSTIMMIVVNVSYFTLTISSRIQATLGQYIMSIYVCSTKGQDKISVISAFDRSIYCFLLFIISELNYNLFLYFNVKIIYLSIKIAIFIFFILWYVVVFMNDKRMTLHDFLCNTIVVNGRLK